MIRIGVSIRPIRTPNFILSEDSDDIKWPVSELDAGTLSALCDQFREDMFIKAGKKDPRPKIQ